MEKNNTKKKLKSPIVSFMLFITLISSIGFFITTLMYKENDVNLLYILINSIILFLFTIFFISASITNNSKHKGTTFIGSLLLIVYFGLGILTNMNLITIPNLNKVEDFRGKNLTSVVNWASKNNVELNQEYEYSDMIDEYKVISQNLKPGVNPKDKTLTVSISEGPSPNKDVVIPNMVTWDSERVLEFIKKNHLSNVSVEFIESDKVKDTLIEQSKSGNSKRNDELKLTFSLGEDPIGDTKLIDLTNKTEFETIFYLKQHKINYEIKKDFSNKIKRGNTSKQSIKPGIIIKVDTKVDITISKGKKIKVPNLKKMDIDSITKWIISNRLKLNISDKYDEKVKDNHVISSNHKKGDIIEQGSLIELVISKGKLKMPKFRSLAEFYEWADKYSIKYEEKHEFSDIIKQGDVIKYSVKAGKAIKNNEVIIVTISDGKECKVPDLKDLTKSEAIKRLKSAHLNYSFIYKNSNSIKKDKVISQSIKAGSKVSNNTTITITLSNGKKETEATNKRKNSTTSKNNKNNNANGNNNSQPVQPPKPTCKACTISSSSLKSAIVGSESFSASASALTNTIKSQCPGITVRIYGDSTSDKRPGVFVSGFSGGTTNSCSTVTITLAQ